jgi:hypothetical protein
MIVPFLLLLAGKAPMPKMLCFVSSLLALLLSVEPYGAVMPWAMGMIVAVVSILERFRSSYGIYKVNAAGSLPPRQLLKNSLVQGWSAPMPGSDLPSGRPQRGDSA